MGLPWLKVREDLHEDPAVLWMSSQLDTRPEHVVGYCVRFWAWVSRNCHGGSVTGVTLLSVERVLNLPGFCDMLRDVGWLEYDDSGARPVITIPKYDRHLSDGAKERALATERKSKERKRKESGESDKTPEPAIAHGHDSVTDMSRSERDKSVTRGDEIRGYESKGENIDTSSSEKSKRHSFAFPSVSEVADYCRERSNNVDPEQFCDYYAARNWVMTNGKKMADWRAAVRTWEKNSHQRMNGKNLAKHVEGSGDPDYIPF